MESGEIMVICLNRSDLEASKGFGSALRRVWGDGGHEQIRQWAGQSFARGKELHTHTHTHDVLELLLRFFFFDPKSSQ